MVEQVRLVNAPKAPYVWRKNYQYLDFSGGHMSHIPFYDRLLQEITPGLERRIMEILASHIGQENRIKRDDLVRQAIHGFGSFTKVTDADDRKVRLAIASLQEQGYPILSDSGEGGRWLAKPEEIDGYTAELESRRERLAEKIMALRRADRMVWVNSPEPPLKRRLF